ncbi:MAG: DnaB-like helicase N-terminal domain-containing protein [Candidatus Acidiferrum sp.]
MSTAATVKALSRNTNIAPPLPNNLDAERSVLGAVLLDNRALDAARSILRQEDFFLDQHRRVFQQMVALAENQQPIDLVTLTDALHRRSELEAAGGAPYIASLADGMPKVSNVTHYAKIVRENALRRELVHAAERIQNQALENDGTAKNLASQAAQSFRELAVGEATESGTPEERLSNLLDEARTKVGSCEVPFIVGALQSELRQIAQPQDFPAPLAKIALQGVVGKFVEAALPCIEADESCLVYQFLTAMGNVMGKNNHARFGPDIHYPNLFTLIVGDTSAGKGQAFSATKLLMGLIDPSWTSHCKYSAASGEAIVKMASEIGDDGRLCLAMNEMSVLLNGAKRDGSNTSGYLRMGWDGIPLENNRARSSEVARDYLLSLIGHITPEELTEIFANVDWYNGMANRFLWATVRKSKTVSRSEKLPNFADVSKTIQDLLSLPRIGQVRFTDEGGRYWDEWVHGLTDHDGKLGASQQRIRPNALRIAQIYAALNERRLSLGLSGHYAIEPEHIAAAIEIVTRSRESIAWFLDRPMKIDARVAMDEVAKFRTDMNKHGGQMTGRQLAALFSHKTPEQRMEIASRAGGKIRSRPSAKGGRPADVWSW